MDFHLPQENGRHGVTIALVPVANNGFVALKATTFTVSAPILTPT
jgi:hypothetical protein